MAKTKIWQDISIVKKDKLPFGKMKLSNNFTPIGGNAFIAFKYPTSPLGSNGNNFDPESMFIYENGNPTQLKKGDIYEFQRDDVTVLYVFGEIPEGYITFYTDEVVTEEEEEIEKEEGIPIYDEDKPYTPKEEVGENYILYKLLSSDKCYIDKKQIHYSETVSPYEHKPNTTVEIGWGEWEDTGDKQQSSRPCEHNTCDCGSEITQKIEDGTICEGAALCKRYRLQYKNACNSNWTDYNPKIYIVGEIIDNESENCGASELELRDDGFLCDNCDKYAKEVYWLKEKGETEWKRLDCPDLYVKGDLILRDSFSCCDKYKTEDLPDVVLCYDDARIQYPDLYFDDYRKYTIRTTVNYIAPSDHNEEYTEAQRNYDGVEPIKWYETSRSSRIISSVATCDCGYYTTSWAPVDEFICGSVLGEGYVEKSQYRKEKNYRYCDDVLIPEEGDEYHPQYTPEERWVEYDNQSCECGYRITGVIDYIGSEQTFTAKTDLEYAQQNPQYIYYCGEDVGQESGYMYFEYHTVNYEECVDGSNFLQTKISSGMTIEHSIRTTEYECIFDEETNANTTKKTTIYRTYRDRSDKNTYKKIYCNGDYVIFSEYTEIKSRDCGYIEEWNKIDEGCCGYIEASTGYTPPRLTINSFYNEQTDYQWTRDGFTFTSPNNTYGIDEISAYCTVNITVNKQCKLVVDYNQSSENGYDYFVVYSGSTTLIDGRNRTTGTSAVTIDAGSQTLRLLYRKDSSQTQGRDNAILTFSVDDTDKNCDEYSKYNIERKRYSTDSGSTWIDVDEYRYGSRIAYQSEDCGYIPRFEQWKLVCDDTITYDTAETGDTHTFITKSGKSVEIQCVICEYYQPSGGARAMTMYAAEVHQYSEDYGATWYVDEVPYTRTERILKYKAGKCGYTGDTFQVIVDKEECIDGILYVTQHQQVSSDDGKTWTDIPSSTQTITKGECTIEEGGE